MMEVSDALMHLFGKIIYWIGKNTRALLDHNNNKQMIILTAPGCY